MGDKEAKIRLGVESGDAVGKLRSVKDELGGFGKMAEGLTSTLKGVADGLLRMGTDAARASNGLKAIDFGSAADKYKAADDQLTRMAVRGGKNVDDLKAKFRDFGGQAGVSMTRFASAVKEFDSATFSGADGAAEAMKSLGVYAEDTDRALEDMLSLGEALTTKLGIPAQRVGAELAKIKSISSDAGMASGFLGIERTLLRLAPLLGRIQGGATRGAAENAALKKQGYSQEEAELIQERVNSAFVGATPRLVRQATRTAGLKEDPYVRGPGGKQQLSRNALKALQRYVRKRPLQAATDFFGGGVEGEEVARAYAGIDYEAVERSEAAAIREEEIRQDVDSADLSVLGRGARAGSSAAALAAGRREKRGSKFSGTVAGKRIRTDLADAQVEAKVGEVIQLNRDRSNEQLAPGTRAVLGTLNRYMPTNVQNFVDVAAGGAAAGARGLDKLGEAFEGSDTAKVLQVLPQTIGEATRKGVEAGLKGANIKVRPDPLGKLQSEARQSG